MNTTVTADTQIWATMNLNVDHYRNGDSIPEVRDSVQWSKLTSGAWCYYKNDPANGQEYGKLYNWYAVNDNRGLATLGWHIPTDAEWKTLEIFLGMGQILADNRAFRGNAEGGKLKETGTSHWIFPNTGATNEIGFYALPGGYRYFDGRDYAIGDYGSWWSASEFNTADAWNRYLYFSYSTIGRFHNDKSIGFSVRCVKDIK